MTSTSFPSRFFWQAFTPGGRERVAVRQDHRVATQLALAQVAHRSLPALFALLFVAFTTSIIAVRVVSGVIVIAGLLRLLDPTLGKRHHVPLAPPLLAFALLTLASAVVAKDPLFALLYARHLLYILLFVVAVNAFSNADQICRTLRWLFAAVGLVSIYSILQVWACATSIELPAWIRWALRVKLGACFEFRAMGFFSIYMTLGGSLVIALSMLLAFLALAFGRHTIWLTAPTIVALVAIALTHARNAWLGLVAAIALLFLLTRRSAFILPLGLAGLVALAAPSPLRSKLQTMLDPWSDSARERFYFWDAGVRMVKDAPLLGLGPGGTRLYYHQYKHPHAVKPRTEHLHNNFVQIAAERGLLGLTAWLWIWAAFLTKAARIYRALPPARGDARALVAGSLVAVAGFLVAGLFEYNFGDPQVIDLLWVVMAFPFVVARDAAPASPSPTH